MNNKRIKKNDIKVLAITFSKFKYQGKSQKNNLKLGLIRAIYGNCSSYRDELTCEPTKSDGGKKLIGGNGHNITHIDFILLFERIPGFTYPCTLDFVFPKDGYPSMHNNQADQQIIDKVKEAFTWREY